MQWYNERLLKLLLDWLLCWFSNNMSYKDKDVPMKLPGEENSLADRSSLFSLPEIKDITRNYVYAQNTIYL